MDLVSRLYFNACKELGLNPTAQKDIHGFNVSLGKQIYYFRSGYAPFNNSGSAALCYNKFSTNKILEMAGIPVPKAMGITKIEYRRGDYDLSKINLPVVIKPTLNTACGKDVFCNIKSKELLSYLLCKYFKKHPCISIEEFQAGLRSYRVTVFYNKVIAVTERIPAQVIGDGMHTIKDLIKIENAQRKTAKDALPLGRIRIMPESKIIFEEMGISSDYIPFENEAIPLRYICNSTYGGNIIGLGATAICKENAELACQAARVLGLNFVGFDILCENIQIPIAQSRGFFIEANPNPDISIHENVITGKKIRVSKIIARKLISQNFISYVLTKAKHKNFTPLFMFIILIVAWSYTYVA